MTTIYLSSTYEDLKEYRRAVFDALRKSGYTVIAMEDHVATDQRPLEACLKDISDRADIYIGIFAFRYGYIPPEDHIRKCEYTAQHDDWQGLSITELEFRYAKETGLPCLNFVTKDGIPWPLEYVDAYSEQYREQPGFRIDHLRKYLLREETVSQFSSNFELASLVQAAATKQLQTSTEDLAEKVHAETTITWDIGKDGSPYPGLMHFTRRFAPVFFGREREVREIFERLFYQNTRFILVSGDSGVGKSSIVDAGLLPKLEEGVLPGANNCVCVRMVPSQGHHPFDALMRALHTQAEQAGLDPYVVSQELFDYPSDLSSRIEEIAAKSVGEISLVLFLDQMEELFTGQAQRHAGSFITALYTATQKAKLWVVATIRNDYIHHCYRYPALLQVMRSHGHYPIGQVDPIVMVDMVNKPAQCAGLVIAKRLVRRIARESGSEPGSLPLLAFVLQRLFDQRDGHELSEHVYDGFGGVDGAITDHVKTVEHKLRKTKKTGEAGEDLLPKLFQKLLVVDTEGMPTRRRMLLNGFGDDLSPLVEKLINARLLSTEGEGKNSTVSVAHEKLFEAWPTLATWISENKEDLHLLRQVRLAAAEWSEKGRVEHFLWPHERLLPVSQMLETMRPTLNSIEMEFVRPESERLLKEIDNASATHQQRVKIGDRLSEISDPRTGVGLRNDGLPDIAWCEVPEGPVSIEETAEIFFVEKFYISKYPVTWIQYRSFLETEEGYQNERWWNELGEPQNKAGEQYRKIDNHPAENLSWYDAMVFCRWLTEHLGCDIQLPTEWQWKKAASGGDPFNKFPWGPKWNSSRANTLESGLSRTTAVGLYPQGESPVGALDMCGNVWEWCLNDYDRPDSIYIHIKVRRALRGGSWYFSQSFAHCFDRYTFSPDFRDNYIGFRLASTSPIM